MKAINYVKNQFNILWKAFDLRKFLYVLIIDTAAFGLLILMWQGFGNMLRNLSNKAQEMGLTEQLQNIDISNAAMIDSSFRTLGIRMIWVSVLLVLAMFLLWVVSQLSVWLIITDSDVWKKGFGKINFAYLKFFFLNIVWQLIWVIPLMFAFSLVYNALGSSVGQGASSIVYLLFFLITGIYFYITTIAFYCFAKGQKVWKSIGLSFNLGVTKIHHFIVPGIINIGLLMLIGLLTMPLSIILPGNISSWVYMILFFAHSAVISLYFAKIIAKIQQSNPELAVEESRRRKK
jgi:hypothetical protein